MEEENRLADLFEKIHSNYLRDLALSVILLEDEEVNKGLFEYIQFVGDMELLGEVTRLTMKAKSRAEYRAKKE